MNISNRQIIAAMQFHCVMVAEKLPKMDGSASVLSTILGMSESQLQAMVRAVINAEEMDRLHWGQAMFERYERAMNRTAGKG